jgi:oligogalacturonide transporter
VAFVVGPILDASGLVRSIKIQPVHVVNTAVTIMLVGSLGLMIFGFLVSLRFKLNRDTHTVLMDEIERFKKQPGTAAHSREPRGRRGPHGLEIRRTLGKGKS